MGTDFTAETGLRRKILKHFGEEKRMNAFKCAVVGSLLLFFNTAGYANPLYMDDLDVRLDTGYGYAASKDRERGMGYHAGVRILSSVRSLSSTTADKQYGIEIASVSPFESKGSLRGRKYMAVGIMLEQMLPEHFVVTIGTIGYIGIDQNKNNPFGLLTEIGWEPRIASNSQLFAALRLESIYDTSTISRYSLSAGIKFNVF
jgi:hypothetical protein